MASLIARSLALAALLAATPVQAADITLDPLPAQQLTPGQCGLFLWSRSNNNPLITVLYDQPALVVLSIDGRERRLPRDSFSGEPQFGHFQSQTFTDGRHRVGVDIEFDSGRPIQDGAVVRRGLVRVGAGDAPETVIPVGGMVACKRA